MGIRMTYGTNKRSEFLTGLFFCGLFSILGILFRGPVRFSNSELTKAYWKGNLLGILFWHIALLTYIACLKLFLPYVNGIIITVVICVLYIGFLILFGVRYKVK